jgi:hypothetical protein
MLKFKCKFFQRIAAMTLDEKVRLGMLGLTGATLVFAALGLHIKPLEAISGGGTH